MNLSFGDGARNKIRYTLPSIRIWLSKCDPKKSKYMMPPAGWAAAEEKKTPWSAGASRPWRLCGHVFRGTTSKRSCKCVSLQIRRSGHRQRDWCDIQLSRQWGPRVWLSADNMFSTRQNPLRPRANTERCREFSSSVIPCRSRGFGTPPKPASTGFYCEETLPNSAFSSLRGPAWSLQWIPKFGMPKLRLGWPILAFFCAHGSRQVGSAVVPRNFLRSLGQHRSSKKKMLLVAAPWLQNERNCNSWIVTMGEPSAECIPCSDNVCQVSSQLSSAECRCYLWLARQANEACHDCGADADRVWLGAAKKLVWRRLRYYIYIYIISCLGIYGDHSIAW